MKTLPPWARGPLDLISHAEGHLRVGHDFDRRIALITFDNSIEASITVYLSLHPKMRGKREYPQDKVEGWLFNFYTRMDFLEEELATRKLKWTIPREHLEWAHKQRNEMYHGGHGGTPTLDEVSLSRSSAFWVFSLLYDDTDVEDRIAEMVDALVPPQDPEQDSIFDRAIDKVYDMVTICGQSHPASEALFSVDPEAYRELGLRLTQEKDIDSEKET